jgi:photosystem II stability/assembly factor-like uncharacterized protein
MNGTVRLLVGTVKGAHIFESADRRKWRALSPRLTSHSVSWFAANGDGKTIYATTLSDGVWKSVNGGKAWKPMNVGLHIRKTWSVAVDRKNPDTVYCGTHYGHIFRSGDGGRVWKDLEGFYKVPDRKEWTVDWGFGTIGNCVHRILTDPRSSKRLYVVSSAGGMYATADSGETWEKLIAGLSDDCPKKDNYAEHLQYEHSCMHAAEQTGTTMYCQMHCGVYRFDAKAKRWQDISAGLPSRHGFPLAVDKANSRVAYVITADQEGQCKKHNSCIRRPLYVSRTRNAGRTWDNVNEGLPKKPHTCVLRHAMDADQLDPMGVYFGTTTGELYGTNDGGDSYFLIAKGLPRIQGVVAQTA